MSAAENVVEFPVDRAVTRFAMVPMDVLVALSSARLTLNQADLLRGLMIQTWGYGKQADDLTITRLAAVGGVPRTRASAALNALVARRIISTEKGKYGFIMSINPVSEWLGVEGDAPDREVSEGVTCVTNHNTIQHQSMTCVTNHDDGGEVTHVTNHDSEVSRTMTHNIKPKYITTPPYIPPCGSGLPADVAGGDASEPDGLPPVVGSKGKCGRRAKTTMQVWLDGCKAAGEKPLPADDPVFADAKALGIDMAWLRLAWVDFKARYTGPDAGRKRYADWRAVFRRAVRECWCKFWFMAADGSGMQLTSIGLARLALAKQAGELAGG